MLKRIASSPIKTIIIDILTIVGFFFSLSDHIILKIVAVLVVIAILLIQTILQVARMFRKKEIEKTIIAKYDEQKKKKAKKIYTQTSQLVSEIIHDHLRIHNDKMDDSSFIVACESVCKTVRSLLLETCGMEVSVCVKRICVDNVVDFDYDKGCTQTLVRVGEDRDERSTHDHEKQFISENTSFYEILHNNLASWASSDLEKTKEQYKLVGNEYKNPDSRQTEFYSSTIVAPIRIHTDYMPREILAHSSKQKPNCFHCIAFLCVDSTETYSPSDENFTMAMRIVRECGKGLYLLFADKVISQLMNNKGEGEQS